MFNKLRFQLFTPYSESLEDFDFIKVWLQIQIVLVCSLLLLNIFEIQV